MSKRVNLSSSERYYILARDAFACQYCGRKAPDVALHVDHMVPVAMGGNNDPLNLIASCAQCNLSKSDEPLSKRVIQEKQTGIKRRTETHEQEVTLRKRDNSLNVLPEHLVGRPQTLLRTMNSNLPEPLRGKSLHPDKRHALKVTVNAACAMTMEYVRERSGGWEEQAIHLYGDTGYAPTTWRPLDEASFTHLIDSVTFQPLDYVAEYGLEVRTYRSVENVFGIQVINPHTHQTATYSFWVPLQQVEVAIVFDTTEAIHSQEEDAFWEEHHLND